MQHRTVKRSLLPLYKDLSSGRKMSLQCLHAEDKEMDKMEKLRIHDYENFVLHLNTGNCFLNSIKTGQFRLFCTIVHQKRTFLLDYHIVKGFEIGFMYYRMDVLTFYVRNGFQVHRHVYLKSLLHHLFQNEAFRDTERIQPFIRFIMDHKFNVNYQKPPTFVTPLHLACKRGWYAIATLLVLYGADVNAIAKVHL